MSGFGLGTSSVGNLTAVGTLDVDGATALDQVTIDTTDGVFDVSGTNKISLVSSNAAADAIDIDASNAAGGIDIDAGTNGISLSSGDIIGSSSSSSGVGYSLTSTKDILLETTGGEVRLSAGINATDYWYASKAWQFVESKVQATGALSFASTAPFTGTDLFDIYKIVFNCNCIDSAAGNLSFRLNDQATASSYFMFYIDQVSASMSSVAADKGFLGNFDEADRSISGEIMFTANNTSRHGSGGHFFIYSPTPTTYYVWYNINESNTDPAPSGTAIEVNILSTDDANTVATKTAAAIDALGDFGATSAGAVVTVTNAANGNVTDAADFDAGVTVNVTQQGDGSNPEITDVTCPAAGLIGSGTGIVIRYPVACHIGNTCTTGASARNIALFGEFTPDTAGEQITKFSFVSTGGNIEGRMDIFGMKIP